jgi:Protein of unknown function (DUF1566)
MRARAFYERASAPQSHKPSWGATGFDEQLARRYALAASGNCPFHDRNRDVIMRATALLVLALAALPFSCGSDSDPLGGLASGCKLTSECDAGLVCTFGRCHEECETSVDCPPEGRCVKVSGDNHVCVLPQEDADCTYNSMCENPLVCAVDQRCRNQCTKARDCITGQVCATTGVCADTDEVDDAGNLISTGAGGGGAGETSSGGTTPGGASSGGASSGGKSSGGTVNGGADGGDAGAGGLPCQGVLPGGGCSYCPLDACENGDCVSGDRDYSCDCLPGYSGTGTKSCALSDPCSADLSCPADYPCAPTQQAGGFSCVGEFASWPMPDLEAPDGAKPSYSGATDTAVDNVTRLEWQRVTPADCTPAGVAVPVPCDWTGAKSYCDALDLGGKTDWRLPSTVELESLLDCVHSFTPFIDEVVFPNTVNGRYWSSSPIAGSGYASWVVEFNSCTSASADRTATYPVRCVRGNGLRPSTASEHYTSVAAEDGSAGASSLAGETTVVDNWTGLTWEGRGTTMITWDDAGTYCQGLGHGFRLPTIKELMTLVEPSRKNPAIKLAVFPDTSATDYWSSTFAGWSGCCGNTYHTVSSADGASSIYPLGNKGAVRCVHH